MKKERTDEKRVDTEKTYVFRFSLKKKTKCQENERKMSAEKMKKQKNQEPKIKEKTEMTRKGMKAK